MERRDEVIPPYGIVGEELPVRGNAGLSVPRQLRLGFANQQAQHHGALVRGTDRHARRHQAEAVRNVARAVAAQVQMAEALLRAEP